MEKAKLAPRMEAFERALRRFVEGLAKPEDAIVRDACIQRFEFTFEQDMSSYSRSCWSDCKRGIGGVPPKVYEWNLKEIGSMLGAKLFAPAPFLLRLS